MISRKQAQDEMKSVEIKDPKLLPDTFKDAEKCAWNVEAFLKRTTIAYGQHLVLFLGSRLYAIAVLFKNASTQLEYE